MTMVSFIGFKVKGKCTIHYSKIGEEFGSILEKKT